MCVEDNDFCVCVIQYFSVFSSVHHSLEVDLALDFQALCMLGTPLGSVKTMLKIYKI